MEYRALDSFIIEKSVRNLKVNFYKIVFGCHVVQVCFFQHTYSIYSTIYTCIWTLVHQFYTQPPQFLNSAAVKSGLQVLHLCSLDIDVRDESQHFSTVVILFFLDPML